MTETKEQSAPVCLLSDLGLLETIEIVFADTITVEWRKHCRHHVSVGER